MPNRRNAMVIAIAGILLVGMVSALFIRYQNRKSQTILNLTTEQKLSDFDTLCGILNESYPFWQEAEQAGIDQEALYNTYRAGMEETKTDIAFFKNIGYFLKEFKGLGHLSVLDGSMYRLYMDAISDSDRLLSPGEKQKIQPLREVLENPVSKNTYEQLDQSHTGFRSIIGLKEEYKSQAAEAGVRPSQLTTAIYKEKHTAYMKISSFELGNYEADKAILTDFYSQIGDVPNLIIDLRGNSGGSDVYWKELLVQPNAKERYISQRYYLFCPNETTKTYLSAVGIQQEDISVLPEPFFSRYRDRFSYCTTDRTAFEAVDNPYRGRIWVLIDEKVYSASENFVMFCKNTGFATLVGTATGGDGGIADPLLVALPNSGLIIRFSIFYGLNADGSGNEAKGTTPDITIAEDGDALEECFRLIEGSGVIPGR